MRAYAAGYLIPIILSVSAFAQVMSGGLVRGTVIAGIFIAAAVQMLVHFRFFLHLNGSSAARWNLVALLLTLAILAFFVAGTIWIMVNLHYRMM